jgi:hypothetical protein
LPLLLTIIERFGTGERGNWKQASTRMFETLFGIEMMQIARYVGAFLVVLALLLVAIWLMRRLGTGRPVTMTRGRQPRLAVIDAATVDGRRRLVLIRRDNVEPLLLIGGPTDLVIEQNIMRAVPVAASREAARPGAEPVPRSPEAPRPAAADAPWPEAARALRPDLRPASEPRLPEPRAAEPAAPGRPERPPLLRAQRGAPEGQPGEARPSPSMADITLADMAQRLGAALRRSSPPEARPAEKTPPEPPTPHKEDTAASAGSTTAGTATQTDEPTKPEAPPAVPEPTGGETARPSKRAEAKRADSKAAPTKSVLDSLEEEMASLLGRTASKS